MRWPLSIWRGMFAPSPADFVADAKADPVIERGRYLVEGLATAALAIPAQHHHAGKALSNSESDDYLSGSNAPIDGWVASSLRSDRRMAWAAGAKPS